MYTIGSNLDIPFIPWLISNMHLEAALGMLMTENGCSLTLYQSLDALADYG